MEIRIFTFVFILILYIANRLQTASENIGGRDVVMYLFDLDVAKEGTKKIVFYLTILERNKFALLTQYFGRLSQNQAG